MRLVEAIRRKNRERLARRHARTRILESIAANQTSVLDALVFLLNAARAEQQVREAAQAALLEQLDGVEKRLSASLQRAWTRAETLERRLDGVDDPAAGSTVTERTRRTELLNPELDLLAHLARSLPHRTALDVGAHVGDVSAALLDAGLAVHAFEPAPETFRALAARLGGRPGFVAHPLAVGRTDGAGRLHLVRDLSGGKYGDPSLYSSLVEHAMLPDLQFGAAVPVKVRSLDSLHRGGEIPAEIGLVKIDTEGLDLDVIRGMGERTYPLVVAEFWDPECEFGRVGAQNRLDELVAEMRRRGYGWHVVLYRVWGRGDVAWYSNRSASVERSWGNVFFFRDRSLFARARRWCAEGLPCARFAPAVDAIDGARAGNRSAS